MNHAARIEKVRSALGSEGVEALLVTDLANVRYLTGFSGTNGQVLVTSSSAFFMSDPRYEARAASLVEAAEIAIYPVNVADLLPGLLAEGGVSRLGVEGATMTLAARDELADHLQGVELVVTKGLIESLRRKKEPTEVDRIREAATLADDAFSWVLDRLVPGVSEREVALDLEMRMRLSGAEEVSFPPIVGSGPLSAHIHHSPSERTFEKGDLVLLDLGARLDGYCSDLTRTVVLSSAEDRHVDLYATVLEAQQAAISHAKAGVEAAYLDRVARRVIEEAGHGEHFGHGLGHGVGLEIHEAPTLKKVSKDVLTPGDVVTIEPGIYLPETGGIRIEDCVLITEDGCEALSGAAKNDLIEL